MFQLVGFGRTLRSVPKNLDPFQRGGVFLAVPDYFWLHLLNLLRVKTVILGMRPNEPCKYYSFVVPNGGYQPKFIAVDIENHPAIFENAGFWILGLYIMRPRP